MTIETVEIPKGIVVGSKYGDIRDALMSAGFERAVRFSAEDFPLIAQNPNATLQWSRRFPGERIRRQRTGNSMTIWREKRTANGAAA